VFVYVLRKIDFSPQPLLIMWKTGGVMRDRLVDNLSRPVENLDKVELWVAILKSAS
jgi:hypothetical protein